VVEYTRILLKELNNFKRRDVDLKFRRGKVVGHEPCIKRGRSHSDEGQAHSHGGRGVPKWRGRTIKGAGVDFSLKENLTDCVNDSEQQDEGIEIGEAAEYEFEYSLL